MSVAANARLGWTRRSPGTARRCRLVLAVVLLSLGVWLQAVPAPAATPAPPPDAETQEARRLEQAGRTDEAMARYEKALAAQPAAAALGTRLSLARLQLNGSRLAAAEETLRPLLTMPGGQPPEVWLLAGMLRLRQGHPSEAETALRTALLLAPDLDAARLGLLDALQQQGRYLDAAIQARETLWRGAARAELWVVLGNAALHTGNEAEAAVFLDCARRLGATTPEALATLGDLYLNLGLPADAARLYGQDTVLRTAPPARLLNAAEAFLAQGETPAARQLLEKLAPRQPPLTTPEQLRRLVLLARAVLATDGPGPAAVLLREALTLDPLSGEALWQLADCQRRLHLAPEAGQTLQRLQRLEAWRVRALVAEAELAAESNELPRAVALLQQAQRLQPRPELARYLEQLQRFAGRPPEE